MKKQAGLIRIIL